MVTGLAEGEAVSGLIRQLAVRFSHAISPSLSVACLTSCTDWSDKVLWGEISSFWVNKQTASFTKMPEIGFQSSHPSGHCFAFTRLPA